MSKKKVPLDRHLPDIDQLYRESQRFHEAERAKVEETKLGVLRAGNTGLVLPDGTVTGKCHRLTALRFMGIDAEAGEGEDLSRGLMFDAGFANEDQWLAVLKRVWNGIILREEEIPIRWQLKDGTWVTGRPDIVLASYESDEDEVGVGKVVPQKGIELKLVCSVWTARDVLSGKPKAMHLMQAAHYMWQLGVPYELWYTSRVDWPIVGWMTKLFPQKGDLTSDVVGYKEKVIPGETPKTIFEPFKIFPFRVGYELRWGSRGFLEYRRIYNGHRGEWETSIVTVAGIEAYFERVMKVVNDGDLGKRPVNLDVDGSKGSYAICDYCPLKPVCDKHEKAGSQEWLTAVTNAPKVQED